MEQDWYDAACDIGVRPSRTEQAYYRSSRTRTHFSTDDVIFRCHLLHARLYMVQNKSDAWFDNSTGRASVTCWHSCQNGIAASGKILLLLTASAHCHNHTAFSVSCNRTDTTLNATFDADPHAWSKLTTEAPGHAHNFQRTKKFSAAIFSTQFCTWEKTKAMQNWPLQGKERLGRLPCFFGIVLVLGGSWD